MITFVYICVFCTLVAFRFALFVFVFDGLVRRHPVVVVAFCVSGVLRCYFVCAFAVLGGLDILCTRLRVCSRLFLLCVLHMLLLLCVFVALYAFYFIVYSVAFCVWHVVISSLRFCIV